jgi:hypothetical protein
MTNAVGGFVIVLSASHWLRNGADDLIAATCVRIMAGVCRKTCVAQATAKHSGSESSDGIAVSGLEKAAQRALCSRIAPPRGTGLLSIRSISPTDYGR